MKVLLLGTGTSQGVPMIAHDSPGLDMSNPKNYRNRSCAHIISDGLHLQIDAGPEFRISCIKYNVTDVDYIFLTHEHSDHILGIDDLRRFCNLKNNNALPIYGTQHCLERIKNVFDYAIRPHSDFGYVALNPIEMPNKLILNNKTEILSFPLPHLSTTSLGFVFIENSTQKKCAYFTDCNDIPDAAIEAARDADLLIIDGLRPAEHPSHLSIDQAVFFAQKINAKKTFLTHMTYQIDYETWKTKLPKNIEPGFDGLTINL